MLPVVTTYDILFLYIFVLSLDASSRLSNAPRKQMLLAVTIYNILFLNTFVLSLDASSKLSNTSSKVSFE